MLKKLPKKTKYVNVRTCEDYFNLPRSERTLWGFWYLKPYALPWERLKSSKNEKGWDYFNKKIKQQFPVQYFFREVLSGEISSFKYSFYMNYIFPLKSWFKNYHKEIRAQVPRSEWKDISTLIEDVNFQIIVNFYKESQNGHTDWEYEGTKDFYQWLVEAHKIITEEFPKYEEKLDELLSIAIKSELSYEKSFSEHNRLEEEFDNLKTKILKEMVERRNFFWT